MLHLLLLLFLFLISIATGSGEIDFSILGLKTEIDKNILLELRLPRTLIAIIGGASLGLCGCVLQSLLRNPLAEPYTLGVSGGASLGAAIAIGLNLNPLWLSMPILAFMFCIFTTFLLLRLSYHMGFWDYKSIILVGLMISLFCGSAFVFILNLLQPQKMSMAIYWLSGQTGSLRDHWWPLLSIVYCIALIYFLYNSKNLDKLLLGDSIAKNLGVDLKKFRFTAIIIICLLTACCVSITGLIGFLGLMAPHISKFFLKQMRYKQLLILSSYIAAYILLIADSITRLVDWHITSGSLVALFGAPILIYFLTRRKYNGLRA